MNNNFYTGYSEARREMAGKSLKFFATTYFKNYTKLPFAQFHLELFDYLQEITVVFYLIINSLQKAVV